jgi:hypothetical protein
MGHWCTLGGRLRLPIDREGECKGVTGSPASDWLNEPPAHDAGGDSALDGAPVNVQLGGDRVVGWVATPATIAIENEPQQDEAVHEGDPAIDQNAAHPIE